MKRFHVHMQVKDLPANIAFYSRLFGCEPARMEADYAKWMLDDPRLNFAISTRGDKPGVDHLGIQADTPDELAALKAAAESAELGLVDEGETTCCYSRSDKHWVIDPNGLPWEHFHTLASVPVFNEKPADEATAQACCPPAPQAVAVNVCRPSGGKSGCC